MTLKHIPGYRNRYLSTIKYILDPYQFLWDSRKRFGKTFKWPRPDGNLIVTSSQSAIREVFTASGGTFKPYITEVLEDFIGPESIFLEHGKAHVDDRKFLSPFFRGENLSKYSDIFTESSLFHLGEAATQESEYLLDITQRISCDAIIQAIFGIHSKSEVEECRVRINDAAREVKQYILYFPFLRKNFFGLGAWAKFKKKNIFVENIINNQIDKSQNNPGDDILSQMMSGDMPKSKIFDQMRTFMNAGQESVSASTAWAIYHLIKNKEHYNNLKDEIKNIEGANIFKLPFLDAVIKESLRLNPVISDTPRRLVKDFSIDGYQLSKGTGIAPSQAIVHYDEEIYKNPFEFNPIRFIENKYNNYEYFPFGGGERVCIGAAFSMIQIKCILTALIKNFEINFEQSNDTAKPIRNHVLMVPSPIKVSLRRMKHVNNNNTLHAINNR